MQIPVVPPGCVLVRRKSGGPLMFVQKDRVHPTLHEVVDPKSLAEPEVTKPVVPPVPKAPPPLTREEAATMSMKELTSRPEYAALKEKHFKSKEDLIKAMLGTQDEKKEE